MMSMEIASGADSHMEARKFLALDPEAAPFVLFLTKKGADKKRQPAFYSISRDKAFKEKMAELQGGKGLLWVTPDGWLLICNGKSRNSFLWSPVTKQRIGLPAIDEDLPAPRQSVALLSHKANNLDCIVLLLHLEKPIFWFCRLGAGEMQWLEHDYSQQAMQITRIAAVHGGFLIDLQHSIAMLRFSPSPTFMKEAVTHVGWLDTYHIAMCRLVESCGDLFKVVVYTVSPLCSAIEAVRVYKMDFSNKIWVRVNEFGDRAFFLDRIAWGASCSASQSGLDQGSVYFLSGKKGVVIISRPKVGSRQLWSQRGGLNAEQVMYSFLMPLAS